MSKADCYNVLKVASPDDIMDTKEYPLNSRKVEVLYVVIINEPGAVQKKTCTTNHYTDGRQHNIIPIYISQSYHDVLSKMRQNGPISELQSFTVV